MAITYEAAGNHEFASAVSALSFTPDAGTLAGDVFEVQVACRGSATITTPAGTGSVGAKDRLLSGDRNVSVFLWTAAADAPGPVSIPLSASTTGSVTWKRYRGASAVYDDFEIVNGFATGALVAAATTTEDGAWIGGGIFIASGSQTATAPGGWTQRALTAVVRNYAFTKGAQASAGSTGTVTFTVATSIDWCAFQSAIKPAGATPPVDVREVMATGQTEYMPAGITGDVADTPAIWVDPDNAARSVIIGSRKAPTGGGIDVYALDGARMSFLAAGEINNVAVRDFKGKAGWDDRVLVIGTNRTNSTLTYAWLDRATRTLSAAGSTAVGFEPYGCCLYVSAVNGDVYAFVTESTGGAGGLKQYRLTRSGSTVTGTQVRSITTATLSEGMACDDENGWLFLGEEDVGLFRYGAEPGAGSTRVTIDTVGGGRLFADVEGISIAYGRGDDPSYLVVSSQGNSSFAIYELADPHDYVESITVIGDGGAIGATTETDGLCVTRADLSPWWPDGLLVVHDTANTDLSQPASNYKLVDAGRVFPTHSYRATVAAVAGTSTASLTAPAARWSKSPMIPVWFDATAGAWRAILPTATGHRLYTLDPGGNTQGAVVDARQAARVAAVHHAGSTYVLRQHATSSLLSVYSSAWSATLTDATVPLNPADNDASPTAFIRTTNGHLWAACHYGGQVRVTRSTDGGATWATPTTFAMTGTGIVVLLEVGANALLFDTANDGAGRLVRTIPVSAGSIASGSWSTESAGSFPSGITSDDHASGLVLPDGRAFIVAKTTGATTSAQPLLYGLVREPGGTWSTHTIEPGPDTTPRYTRPKITLTPAGEVVAVYGSIEGALDLSTRTMAVDAFGTWSGRSAKALGPNWSDSAVLPAPASLAAAGGRPWPLLAHARDAQTVQVQWQVRASSGQIPGYVGADTIAAMYVGTVPVEAIYLGDLQLV